MEAATGLLRGVQAVAQLKGGGAANGRGSAPILETDNQRPKPWGWGGSDSGRYP
jgi:hypothetical protein